MGTSFEMVTGILRPVFEAYQGWQLELERQPILFLDRCVDEQLRHSRERLGAYLGVRADGLVYFPNPTTHASMLIISSPV